MSHRRRPACSCALLGGSPSSQGCPPLPPPKKRVPRSGRTAPFIIGGVSIGVSVVAVGVVRGDMVALAGVLVGPGIISKSSSVSLGIFFNLS